jgi:hypothetical protein
MQQNLKKMFVKNASIDALVVKDPGNMIVWSARALICFIKEGAFKGAPWPFKNTAQYAKSIQISISLNIATKI